MYSSSSPAFVFEQVLGYMKNSESELNLEKDSVKNKDEEDTTKKDIQHDWIETYPVIAALINHCNQCKVGKDNQGSYDFKICDSHRPQFLTILAGLKELYPMLI